MKRNPQIPSKEAILATTSPTFLAQVRETEYVREYEARLELESLVTDDPAFHPLG